MKIFLMIIIGVAGGVIGGMGMGGGTLLIPLLVIFTDITQHGAQAINLAAFIPMSIAALIIHFKNKLVDFKKAVWIGISAAATAVFSSFLADKVEGESLGRYFGTFLLILGIYQLITAIIDKVKKNRDKN